MLEHMDSILGILRNSNVALRWLLLHSWGAQKKLRAAVTGASPPGDDLLTLLLQIAQLEAEVGPPPPPPPPPPHPSPPCSLLSSKNSSFSNSMSFTTALSK